LVDLAPILDTLEALAILTTFDAVYIPFPLIKALTQTRSKAILTVEIKSNQK
jgi:hypothetical protein